MRESNGSGEGDSDAVEHWKQLVEDGGGADGGGVLLVVGDECFVADLHLPASHPSTVIQSLVCIHMSRIFLSCYGSVSPLISQSL